jgi:hypothetical protein
MVVTSTLVWGFWRKNNDLQDFPYDLLSFEARRQGRGEGIKRCRVLCVVVSGKHRPLSTPMIMLLILWREQEQHEHRTIDGMWCLGVQRGKRMSQDGKGGGEDRIWDRSQTQG